MSVREMELCELSETLRYAYMAYFLDPEKRRESIGFYAAAFVEESLMEGQQLAIVAEARRNESRLQGSMGIPGVTSRYPAGRTARDLGSCSMFDPDSHYAHVLGKEMTDFLMDEHVMGDFLGAFITPDGRIVTPYAPSMTASFIPGADLQELDKREDTLVILAAGGEHKLKLIWQLLELNLCNVFITHEFTAESLQHYRSQLYPDPEPSQLHAQHDNQPS